MMPHEEHEEGSPPAGDGNVSEEPAAAEVAAAPQETAVADDDGRLWFAVIAGSRLGPFSTDDVRRRLHNGDLRPRHFVWRLGFGPHWYRLREVPEFRRDLEQLAPAQATHPGMPERILCTNCYARVLPAWHECPSCGHRLKQAPPSAERVLAADPLHRVVGVAGAVLMLVALVLPWLVGQTASVTGFEGYLGSSFALLALGLGFFAAQSLLGRTRHHRPVLTLALGLWALVLVALFVVEAQAEAATLLAHLDGETAAAAATDTGGLGLLGPGAWLYLGGLLLLIGAFFLPALHAFTKQPLAGGVVVAAIALAALGHMQLVNGNLYAPMLEARLAITGYEVVSIERLDNDEDTQRTEAATEHLTTATHTYRIFARSRNDGRLYRAELTIPLGSLLARTIPMQRIPLEDQPLYELPIGLDSPEAADE